MESLYQKLASLFDEAMAKFLFKRITTAQNEYHIFISLTQSGTDAPVITYSRNDTGSEILITYDSAGIYTMTHPMFPYEPTKLYHQINWSDSSGMAGINKSQHRQSFGEGRIQLTTAFENDPTTPADDLLNDTPMHIVIFT